MSAFFIQENMSLKYNFVYYFDMISMLNVGILWVQVLGPEPALAMIRMTWLNTLKILNCIAYKTAELAM